MSEKLYIAGLSSLDKEELEEAIGKTALETYQPEVPEGSLAEPATITAILTLGSFATVAFATWASKGRRRKLLKGSVKIVHPDGRVEERSWEVDEGSEDAIKSGVIAQLGKWLKVR
jgi:hypothetical protein